MQKFNNHPCHKCKLPPREHSVRKPKEMWVDDKNNYVGPHGFEM